MSPKAASHIVQLAAFRVGTEEYVVDVMRVREIIRDEHIVPVHKGPKFVKGVLNLRGVVVPVVDMHRRFGIAQPSAPRRKILILQVDSRVLGIVVDAVTEVVRVPKSSIMPAPEWMGESQAPYFSGICHYKGRNLILLNIKNVLSTDDPITPLTGELEGTAAP